MLRLFALILFSLLPAVHAAEVRDCAEDLRSARLGKSLGSGTTGWVYVIQTRDGRRFAAKFYAARAGIFDALEPDAVGMAKAFLAQTALAREGLAPRLEGWTNAPTVIAPLVKQLPAKAQKEIRQFGGVVLVTLSEIVPEAMTLQAREQIPASLRKKMETIVRSHQSELLEQIARAEKVLADAEITPIDDQALVQLTPQGARLWVIDFDGYGMATYPDYELVDTRTEIDRLSQSER